RGNGDWGLDHARCGRAIPPIPNRELLRASRSTTLGGRAPLRGLNFLVTSCSCSETACITRTPSGAQPGSGRVAGESRRGGGGDAGEGGRGAGRRGAVVRGARCHLGLSARAGHAQTTRVAAGGGIVVLRAGPHGGAAFVRRTRSASSGS